MTGRFEHFDARSGRSYRLVLAYAHASAAYAVDSLTGTVSLYAMSELRDEPPRSLEDPREILLQQLSYYRACLLAKLDGLSEG